MQATKVILILTVIVARAVVSGVRIWTDTVPIGTVPIVVANEAVAEAAKLKLCIEMRLYNIIG